MVCLLGYDDVIGVVYGWKLFGLSVFFMKKVVDNCLFFF